jgi:hypothetical protein
MNCRRDSECCGRRKERPARDWVLVIGKWCFFWHTGTPPIIMSSRNSLVRHATDPLCPNQL